MPRRNARPCGAPGCTALVYDGRFCEAHAKEQQAAYDKQRGSSARRGYGARWRKLRRVVLARSPLCADPFGIHAAEGRIEQATEVDHIKPKSQGGTNAMGNLQALCKQCHSRKTVLEGKRWG